MGRTLYVCIAPSAGSVPARGPGEPVTGSAPSEVLAEDTCHLQLLLHDNPANLASAKIPAFKP